MLELSPARKNKVNLSDYNCRQDIENRMLIADFAPFDREVLQEILFSPLKISSKKLARNLGCEEKALEPILQKLSSVGLLSIQEETLVVDKEMRKYFEFQMARFDSHFKPDMEFLQGILRKVPIHFLPSWYSIPRTSSNIFESIVEKYLLTPHIFQRYLLELNFGNPTIQGIVETLFAAPDFKVSSSDLIAKYNLARRDFEEILLFLEFHFVCCLTYEQIEDHWVEWVAPFYEWHQYLRFLKETEAPPISQPVLRAKQSDFAFIEEASALLSSAKKRPISLAEIPAKFHLSPAYSQRLVAKLCLVQLAEQKEGRLIPLEAASDWLEMSLENRALYLYRHPLNHLFSCSLSPEVATERNLREAEKAIKRVLHGKWVFFDDFIKGVLVPLHSEEPAVSLKRTGKVWKYTLPTYTEEEKKLIHATIFEWLFEMGTVAIGSCGDRDCFAVTPFGRFFFDD